MNKYVIYAIGNEVRISYTTHAVTLKEAKEKIEFHLSIKYFNDDLEVTVYGGKRIN